MGGPVKNKELGDYILSLRKRRGMTQPQVCERAGIDRTYLSRLERGLYGSPDPLYLERVASALDINVSRLFDLVGYSATPVLPPLPIYLRSRYGLSQEAIEQMQEQLELLSLTYDKDEKPTS